MFAFLARNNVGAAFFQLGEHTLAKLEHQAVLAILEPRCEAFPRLRADEEKCDVYLDTLVNLHRQAWRQRVVSYALLLGRGQQAERPRIHFSEVNSIDRRALWGKLPAKSFLYRYVPSACKSRVIFRRNTDASVSGGLR